MNVLIMIYIRQPKEVGPRKSLALLSIKVKVPSRKFNKFKYKFKFKLKVETIRDWDRSLQYCACSVSFRVLPWFTPALFNTYI